LERGKEVYFAITFNFGGRKCMVAESNSDTSAVYLWAGDLNSGDEWKQTFNDSKFSARDLNGVVALNHINRQDGTRSLDVMWGRIFANLGNWDQQALKSKYWENEMESSPVWGYKNPNNLSE
jgi:hypothetical protein